MSLIDLPNVDQNAVRRNEQIKEAAKKLEEKSNGIITQRQAHAYIARDVIGLGRQETMSIMGVNPSTVDSLLYKAREKVEGAEKLVGFLDK